MANYENYKAEQIGSEPVPTAVGVMIVIAMVFAFFGIYELLGIGFAKIISMINKFAYPPDINQDYQRRGRE